MPSAQSICLSMIVKNEAPVIRRCLDSIRPIVNHWTIIDTGSSDDTQAIIESYLKDLPGELHEHSWISFAHNRTKALELAHRHGDYILIIDADDVLTIEPGFVMPRLCADSYNVLIQDQGLSYHRTVLVRSSLPWYYIGIVHEYIACEQARTQEFLSGLRIIRLHDGARARDPQTYHKDALLLEQALIEDPNNPRTLFYLAQSHRDAGNLETALRYYRARAGISTGWGDETWFSLYQIAVLKNRMAIPWPEVLADYLSAWNFDSTRAEPLFWIAKHYQALRQYSIAEIFLSQAIKMPSLAPDRLFVEHGIYDYWAVLEYAVVLHYVGKYAEAVATNDRLLESGSLPRDLINQVIANRQFSVDVLKTRRIALEL